MRNGHPPPAGMNFDLTDEQSMLRDAAQRFVREHYPLEERRRLAKSEEGFSREHWMRFADLGWLGLNLPEDVGGLGCSFIETALLLEQFGRGMVVEPYLSSIVLCASLVDASGNEHHRRALLPAVIAGTCLLALAHDEPAGRDQPELPATLGVPHDGGYRLRGRKMLALGAPSADSLIVSACLDGEFALFVLDRKRAGVRLAPYALVCGQRAADVHMEDVDCAADALLARGPVARAALGRALDRARLAAMAEALGVMEACQEQTSEYIKGRMQFGQPLAKFQTLQHLMAEMFVDAQESRSILYFGLSCIEAEPERRGLAVASAKLIIGECGRRVTAKGVQLLGGYGTVDEYAVSWHFRLLYVLDHLFGDSTWHAARLARQSPSLA